MEREREGEIRTKLITATSGIILYREVVWDRVESTVYIGRTGV